MDYWGDEGMSTIRPGGRVGRYALGTILVLSAFAVYYFRLTGYSNLEFLQSHMDDIQQWVTVYCYTAVLLYIGGVILVSVLMLPGMALCVMISGFLFNLYAAIIYALIGTTIGATVSFLIARYLIGETIQYRYGSRLIHFNESIERQGYYYLLLVRLSILPFSAVNLLSGLTPLPVRTFFVATAVGLVPYVVVYASIGRQLLHLTYAHLYTAPSIATLLMVFGLFRAVMIPTAMRYVYRSGS
jgi:uncharacterized membrane protein YdjX (TVP38/TMEM64 family)